MYHEFIYFCPIIIIAPLLAIIITRKHLLTALLNLEAATLAIVIFIFILLFSINQSININILILLTMGACEARLGLTCIVIIMRSFGSDMLKTTPIVKC